MKAARNPVAKSKPSAQTPELGLIGFARHERRQHLPPVGPQPNRSKSKTVALFIVCRDAEIAGGFGELIRSRGDERMVHETTLHVGRTIGSTHETAKPQLAWPAKRDPFRTPPIAERLGRRDDLADLEPILGEQHLPKKGPLIGLLDRHQSAARAAPSDDVTMTRAQGDTPARPATLHFYRGRKGRVFADMVDPRDDPFPGKGSRDAHASRSAFARRQKQFDLEGAPVSGFGARLFFAFHRLTFA
jgi:hypothetical protein